MFLRLVIYFACIIFHMLNSTNSVSPALCNALNKRKTLMGNNFSSKKLFDAVEWGDVPQVKATLSQIPSSEALEFRARAAVRIFLQDTVCTMFILYVVLYYSKRNSN